MINQAKLEAFIVVYAKHLKNAVASHPEEYAFPQNEVPVVVGKMRAAFERGSFNKDGRAIKATCKELDIKWTYGGISAYLERQ